MHKLLLAYLQQVKQTLKDLPEERRKSELLELRQHLLHAMAANQAAGQSADEAAANALKEFGSPTELGNRIVDAWLKEDNKKRIVKFMAIVFCWLIFFILEYRNSHHPWGSVFGFTMFFASIYRNYFCLRYLNAHNQVKKRSLSVIFAIILAIFAPAWYSNLREHYLHPLNYLWNAGLLGCAIMLPFSYLLQYFEERRSGGKA